MDIDVDYHRFGLNDWKGFLILKKIEPNSQGPHEGAPGMELTLESGRVVDIATENDIRTLIPGEKFAILSVSSMKYMQCASPDIEPHSYFLEYQDGNLQEHYEVADAPLPVDKVISAFLKYLHGDISWRSDFRWQRKLVR